MSNGSPRLDQTSASLNALLYAIANIIVNLPRPIRAAVINDISNPPESYVQELLLHQPGLDPMHFAESVQAPLGQLVAKLRRADA